MNFLPRIQSILIFISFALNFTAFTVGQRQFVIGPVPRPLPQQVFYGFGNQHQNGAFYADPDFNYYDESSVPLLLRPRPRPFGPIREIKRQPEPGTQTMDMMLPSHQSPPMPPSPQIENMAPQPPYPILQHKPNPNPMSEQPHSMSGSGIGSGTGAGSSTGTGSGNSVGVGGTVGGSGPVISGLPLDMSMMELFYDYYEYGQGPGPDYYPGPPNGGPGPGWYPPPPSHPYPQQPHPPSHSKPPIKGKPKPKPISKPKPEFGGGGGGEDGWSEPQEEKPKDKFSELKDKWNTLLDKLKLKDKDKDKGKDKEKEKVVHQVEKIPSGNFQLEHLPGWNAPPQRNPHPNPHPPQKTPGPGSGPSHQEGSGGWGPPSSPPRRPVLEIWLGPWFKKRVKDEKKK